MENEQLLAALDATKKHLDNDEFVQAAQRQKQARHSRHACLWPAAASASPPPFLPWLSQRCVAAVQADMELMDMAERDVLPAMLGVCRGS